MLFTYMQQVQRLTGDVRQQKLAPNDLIYYINVARRMVAERCQCVRVLTPISGSITSITTLTGGHSYSATPTVTISAPDLPGGTSVNPAGLQATAVAHVVSNTITSITISSAGSGYFAPVVTITDSTGSGATASAAISPVTQLVYAQEVYPFSAMPLGNAPGVSSIFAIKSVAIIYDNYRYILPMYSFSTYQGFVRQYPNQYLYVPTLSCQYGQGVSGSLYMYPLPSQAYSFQVDAFCLPSDLALDTDVEAIPLPWTDAVPYFAAYLAKLEMQDANGAKAMLELFDTFIQRYSVAARPGRSVNPYGRFAIFFAVGLSALLGGLVI